jgi:C-terminal processing protease CtpA/Prc
VATSAGEFGHLRIFSFNLRTLGVTPDEFVAEFIRLIGLLPQNGLILDVRGNGGGHIWASESSLQTLTPRRVVPEPAQFINPP